MLTNFRWKWLLVPGTRYILQNSRLIIIFCYNQSSQT